MCYNCWEGFGEPPIRNAKTERVAELVGVLYNDLGACSGGNLHIVTDDWNLEDGSLAHCRETVRRVQTGQPGPYDYTHPPQVAVEAEILDLMEVMTLPERASALALDWGFEPGD